MSVENPYQSSTSGHRPATKLAASGQPMFWSVALASLSAIVGLPLFVYFSIFGVLFELVGYSQGVLFHWQELLINFTFAFVGMLLLVSSLCFSKCRWKAGLATGLAAVVVLFGLVVSL